MLPIIYILTGVSGFGVLMTLGILYLLKKEGWIGFLFIYFLLFSMYYTLGIVLLTQQSTYLFITKAVAESTLILMTLRLYQKWRKSQGSFNPFIIAQGSITAVVVLLMILLGPHPLVASFTGLEFYLFLITLSVLIIFKGSKAPLDRYLKIALPASQLLKIIDEYIIHKSSSQTTIYSDALFFILLSLSIVLWSLLKLLQHNTSPVDLESLGLTRREKEVAQLLLDDAAYGEIAEKLFISPETVKTHVNNIYRKTEVKSRGELRKKALK